MGIALSLWTQPGSDHHDDRKSFVWTVVDNHENFSAHHSRSGSFGVHRGLAGRPVSKGHGTILEHVMTIRVSKNFSTDHLLNKNYSLNKNHHDTRRCIFRKFTQGIIYHSSRPCFFKPLPRKPFH